MDEGLIDPFYLYRTVGRALWDNDHRRLGEQVLFILLAEADRDLRTQVVNVLVVEARKNQTLVVRMYQGALPRVALTRLFDKPIGKMGVESFQVPAFHPDPRCVAVETFRRFPHG